MRNTPVKNMSRVHHELLQNRAAVARASQVAIYRLTKSGKRCVRPLLYEHPDRVQATLARLHENNPGMRFEA